MYPPPVLKYFSVFLASGSLFACKPAPSAAPESGAAVADADGGLGSHDTEAPAASPTDDRVEDGPPGEDEDGIGGGEVNPGPDVRQGKMVVNGGLTKDIVHRISRAHISDVSDCYDTSLKSNPDLGGRMDVTFQVQENGKVANAKFSGPAAETEALTACVSKSLSAWPLPQPEQGLAEVEFFYEFQPR